MVSKITAKEWVEQSTPQLKEILPVLASEVIELRHKLEPKQRLLNHLRGIIALAEADESR